jgi:hypothetical protein
MRLMLEGRKPHSSVAGSQMSAGDRRQPARA